MHAVKKNMGRFIKIVEVGPRDGLQNEPKIVPTQIKLDLISKLQDAGLKVIEAGAFVSPKWVPQMADSSLIYKSLQNEKKLDDREMSFPCLVPNLKGLETAIECGVTEIAVFGAASQMFSQKNINCSIEKSLQRFELVINEAIKRNIKVRGYVSTVVACPYQGWIKPEQVEFVAKRLLDMGCYEISLGDTIGRGTPNQFKALLEKLQETIPVEKLAVHCHDTYGQAIANIMQAVSMGVRSVDSSIAGLGGCPYAAGASGNVSTEDLVYFLHGMGYETGVDLNKLAATGEWISRVIGRQNMSKVGNAMQGTKQKANL